MAESIGATLPGIEVLPMADLITTFIWQVSIVHSLDHEIYVQILNKNNPWCLTITGKVPRLTELKVFISSLRAILEYKILGCFLRRKGVETC
jgi:hypothetical protein